MSESGPPEEPSFEGLGFLGDLMRLIPKEKWFGFTYVLIDHGRAICHAKKPQCTECPIEPLCPSSQA